MTLPTHRTKIVCTIGPASASAETLTRMMQAGMNVCRLNFAHGDFESHAATIRLIRETAEASGHRVAILGDLPGPKIRLGKLAGGRVVLEKGRSVTLTTAEVEGTPAHLPVQFPELPAAVGPGDLIFLNDGFLQLTVENVSGSEVCCRVDVGGPLLSNKGVNLPGQELPIDVFTAEDREFLAFAMAQRLDAVSQSFVQRPEEIEAVRAAARSAGGQPMIFAKIERAVALRNIDQILEAADGIMVARGDLGVETPIEAIAMSQKRLIERARHAGKLVITATQMLESMTSNARPTRAEATDVANAILDGTDCVMLSEESALGQYPVESVAMLARIAAATEGGWHDPAMKLAVPDAFARMASVCTAEPSLIAHVVANDVAAAVERLHARLVLAPSTSGEQPRLIAAFRPPCWVIAFSPSETICQRLCFANSVYPVKISGNELTWEPEAADWLRRNGLVTGIALITHRWWRGRSKGTNRIEIIDLGSYFGGDSEQAQGGETF